MGDSSASDTGPATQAEASAPARRADEIVSLGLAAVLSTVVFVVVAPVLLRRSTRDCGEGLDGLGCVLVAVYAALAGALLLAAAGGAALMHRRGIRRAPLVALFGASGVGASWLLVRALTSSAVTRWVAIAVAFFLGNLLFHALFNLTRLPVLTSVAVAVVLILGGYRLLTRVGAQVDSERFEREEHEQVEKVDFEIYVPERVPPGFGFDEKNLYEGDGGTMRTHYQLTYVHETSDSTGPPPLTVQSFPVTPQFDPPRDCSHDKPGYKPWPVALPCIHVGKTPNGRDVWFVDDPNSNTRAWYTRIGNVQVTISTTDSPDGQDVPHDQVMELVASLRSRTADQLRDLS